MGSSGTGHDHGSIQSTGQDNGTISGAEVKPAATASHAEFRVEGLCEMCKERIEAAAKSVHGVESADWNMETKQLHLTFGKSHTNIDDVKKTIAVAGHDNDKYRASDDVLQQTAGVLPLSSMISNIKRQY
ncbi:MAG: heavy-metal-associated domain-containing protein [Marinilabiliales bacterium]|nr:heavy-metal-associated domain-containing protein [Marinilabiliales bacterium]